LHFQKLKKKYIESPTANIVYAGFLRKNIQTLYLNDEGWSTLYDLNWNLVERAILNGHDLQLGAKRQFERKRLKRSG
jgi:hypothetical protein